MTREELLRALIAQIDLLMHDKDYRFVESEDTWYSREGCKVLTNQEVYEEICAEFDYLKQDLADATCIIDSYTKHEEETNNQLKVLQNRVSEKNKEILDLKSQLMVEQLKRSDKLTEEQLDKYVGEFVKVKDFDNNIKFGTLYKIKDGVCIRMGQKEYHPISNGYYLECLHKGICYRKSHIKKIEIV